MTAKRDLESRLADFYETEAPRRAPDWVLTDALATIDTTDQRRWFAPAPWRFQDMHGSTRLAAAVIAVVALAAAGVAVLSGGSILRPTPTPSTSPTPGPTVAATFEVAASFRPSFTYVLPHDVRVDYGPQTSDFFEFRVPDSGGVGQAAWFLTVQSVEGGRVFPCSNNGRIPFGDAAAAMAYLKDLPSVTVSGETTTQVDGRSARTATLTFAVPTSDCQDLWLWHTDTGPLPEAFRDPATAFRVMLLDVDGKTIAISTIATQETTDWFRWADEIIATIHFQT